MGKPIPTVAIQWGDESGFSIINQSDFDPAIHKLYEKAIPAPLPDAPVRVDINSATLDELMALPTLGGAKAHRLIANRPFVSLGDAKERAAVDLARIAERIEFG
jgi:DNA uptake protein ComE-like DNA-binding protein